MGWLPACLAVLVLAAGTGAAAQTPPGGPFRIGYVGPTQTGETTIRESIFDLAGDAGRFGAMLAEEDAAAGPSGPAVDVLFASTPSAEAAERAARRLVLAGGVRALVGGIGEGQARALARVAADYGLPFLNIGSSDPELRAACIPEVFHVEASAAMYLDGLVQWFAGQGIRRWFTVYAATGEGRGRHELARRSIEWWGGDGAAEVGAAEAASGQPLYREVLAQAEEAGAEAILLLVGATDQIGFLAQQQSYGPAVPVAPFPETVTQSREFLATAQHLAGGSVPGERIALWETTLEDHGAGELNARYLSRWGRPMEPHAWAAYAAVRILGQAAAAAGSTGAPALMAYLQRTDTSFDLAKGPGVSFRPWDHQLRQPLYIVSAEDAPWGHDASQQIAAASLAGVVPEGAGTAPGKELLDRLGKGAAGLDCRF